jgi:hypothetical protein
MDETTAGLTRCLSQQPGPSRSDREFSPFLLQSAIKDEQYQSHKNTEDRDCVDPIELVLLDPSLAAPNSVALQNLNR